MLSRLLVASNAMLVMILRVVEPTVEKTLFFYSIKNTIVSESIQKVTTFIGKLDY